MISRPNKKLIPELNQNTLIRAERILSRPRTDYRKRMDDLVECFEQDEELYPNLWKDRFEKNFKLLETVGVLLCHYVQDHQCDGDEQDLFFRLSNRLGRAYKCKFSVTKKLMTEFKYEADLRSFYENPLLALIHSEPVERTYRYVTAKKYDAPNLNSLKREVRKYRQDRRNGGASIRWLDKLLEEVGEAKSHSDKDRRVRDVYNFYLRWYYAESSASDEKNQKIEPDSISADKIRRIYFQLKKKFISAYDDSLPVDSKRNNSEKILPGVDISRFRAKANFSLHIHSEKKIKKTRDLIELFEWIRSMAKHGSLLKFTDGTLNGDFNKVLYGFDKKANVWINLYKNFPRREAGHAAVSIALERLLTDGTGEFRNNGKFITSVGREEIAQVVGCKPDTRNIDNNISFARKNLTKEENLNLIQIGDLEKYAYKVTIDANAPIFFVKLT